ncbi:MAG: ribosome silencing factor [Lautropia sp.]|nr:ribosome silencing factor [Lautropia sp.]
MSISELQYLVVDALEDVKAQDIRVFDTGPQTGDRASALSDLFDRVILATATSNRQTRALATRVQDRARDEGYPVVSVEGEATGEWVLVDLGDLIVHIMQPDIRAYYNLEELWGAHPVALPLGKPASRHHDGAGQASQTLHS